MKDQRTRCKLLSLERQCSSSLERLKTTVVVQCQNGVPTMDVWEKALSLFTIRKAVLFHNGYSRCSRQALRLSHAPSEDVAPLCFQK
ncbi:hypothetical protein SKAU_G00158870 [Synaphobranchus kaupii]|uniref:Uncharacterized protein n=1 Tax=Synaphobranchus kaupii TaxID=118154 RepID=A0A9Q1FI39_SYNKA|nr:hypothetical protein SKAU_G00158870 [Synaphobranchus kaupii]